MDPPGREPGRICFQGRISHSAWKLSRSARRHRTAPCPTSTLPPQILASSTSSFRSRSTSPIPTASLPRLPSRPAISSSRRSEPAPRSASSGRRAMTGGDNLKSIISKRDWAPLRQPLRDLIDWVARWTLSPRGAVLRMATRAPEATEAPAPKFGLREDRQAADAADAGAHPRARGAQPKIAAGQGRARRGRRLQRGGDRRARQGRRAGAGRAAARAVRSAARSGFLPSAAVRPIRPKRRGRLAKRSRRARSGRSCSKASPARARPRSISRRPRPRSARDGRR